MLQWPAGRHSEDGVWARHWYGRVESSTGFEGEEDPDPLILDDHLKAVADACLPDYEAMAKFRIGGNE